MSERKLQINKRLKGLPRNELEKLSKTELIDKIVQLQAYNFQLKNVLQKKLDENDKKDDEYVELMRSGQVEADLMQDGATTEMVDSDAKLPTKQQSNKKDKQRTFDFSKSHKRHVLLKLLYFGWDYQGFACQEDSNTTIEYHLFKALTRCCLVESRQTSNYHRCGRTDKEVSAFCQVISIDLRSKFPEVQQHCEESLSNEIDYCGLLNRILPGNIQCIAWMPLKSTVYSARFDCVARTYRYYFPGGDLNIESMRTACGLLERHTDFRNFCKMDVHNGVTNYTRNLQKASVQMCPNEIDDNRGYTMYFLEIQANAFLWHQIRCIMAILLLVGQGKEEPQVISELLDVETNPCKPQYTPAIGLPLNLFQCEFRKRTTRKTDFNADTEIDEVPLEENDSEVEDHIGSWLYNEENLQKLIENIQSEWTQFSVKCTMIRNVLFNLESILSDQFGRDKLSSSPSQLVRAQVLPLQDSVKPRQYQKLLTRKRCESLENRIDYYVKKQKLIERV